MRLITALIVVVGYATGHAQQLERPPLVPAPREATPLFQTVPLDKAVRRPPVSAESAILSWPAPESRLKRTRPTPPPVAAPQNVQQQGSGPVCLRSVPVDPSIDPEFVLPVPTTGLAMRTIVVPPCVTLSP